MKELSRAVSGQTIKYEKFVKPKCEIISEKDPLRNIIVNYLEGFAREKLQISLKELPPSANDLYQKSVRKNHKSQKSFVGVELSDAQVAFRIQVANDMRKHGRDFKPRGVIYSVVELGSSSWLNKDETPKEKDLDNMLKPLYDAFKEAYRVPDELVFSAFVFKCNSDQDKLIATFYDLPPRFYKLE